MVPARIPGYKKVLACIPIEDGTPEWKMKEQMNFVHDATMKQVPPDHEILQDHMYIVSQYDIWNKWHMFSLHLFVRPKPVRAKL